MKGGRVGIGLAAAIALVCVVSAQNGAQNDKAFQAALQKEMVDGDLMGAIAMYQAIAARPGIDRGEAASALLHEANCYRNLRRPEAKAVYERIVREFSDQTAAASEARTRLATLPPPVATSSSSSASTLRHVWSPARSDLDGGNPVPFQFGRVSRSGRLLPFATYGPSGGLFVRDLTTGIDRRLVANKDGQVDYLSVISPDDRLVAYLSTGTRPGFVLRVAPIQVAPDVSPRTLVSNSDVRVPWLLDWSADGKWLAVALQRTDATFQLALVSATDGAVHVLKTTDWRNRPTNASFSPDGRFLAYNLPQADSTARDIFVLATDASREIPAVVHKADDVVLGWSADGRQLFFASNRTGARAIWATTFQQNAFDEPRLIKQDVGEFSGLGLTAAGSLFYLTLPAPVPSQIMTASINFAEGTVVSSPRVAVPEYVGTNSDPVWSHNGKSLAYVSRRGVFYMPSSGAAVDSVLVVRSVETDEPHELRPKLDTLFFPQWSPDDRNVTVEADDFDGRSGVFQVDARTGNPTAVSVVSASSAQVPGSLHWSQDGQTMYFRRRLSGTTPATGESTAEFALVARDVRTGAERELGHWSSGFRRGGGDLGEYAISPDGRTLYFPRGSALADAAPRANQPGFALVAHDLASNRETVLFQGTRLISLSPDGRYLISAKAGLGDQPGNAVVLVPVDGAPPRTLKDADSFTILCWATDSRSVVVQTGADRKEVWWLPIDAQPRRLELGLKDREYVFRMAVHPDGRQVAFEKGDLPMSTFNAKADLWSLDHLLPSAGGPH
jgi:Tol biopolymer transport system component